MLHARGELIWGLIAALAVCRAAPQSGPGTGTGTGTEATSLHRRRLQGRFLQITDIHPDPFYKTYSSTEADAACHRRHGPAGVYGAETSGCDSPFSLVNETFKWIDKHLKDSIDFVVWTGDSARHDNDERIPRTQQQVIEQNEYIVSKFGEVFGARGKGGHESFPDRYTVPIVPTFGNNDIMPHNIFLKGPNKWTSKYLDIWRSFIPEAQRHSFAQGGWFYVEVIPKKLAVFSMNTLYFFDSNSAVYGCANPHEPGYEHMKWLRIQLDIVRERGMKAILIGHVPPARTENKFSWDETCWQKYTLYQRQFRDVIVGSLFGHMNIDHFILHDFKDLKKGTKKGRMGEYIAVKGTQAGISLLEDGEVTVASASDYLSDLGDAWAKLPSPPKSKAKLILPGGGANVDDTESIWQWVKSVFSKSKKSRKGRKGDRSPKERYLHDIGGRYRQRFSVSHVSPSVVPNYFPTIRIFSYNISGLEDILVPGGPQYSHLSPTSSQKPITGDNSFSNDSLWIDDVNEAVIMKKKKKERHAKKRKKYKFVVPSPPSKSAPPGPAYSPQPLTLLGYVQYFANLTYINNDFTAESGKELGEGAEHPENSLLDQSRWSEGKHKKHQGKAPRPTPHPNAFIYEVEYNTTDDKLYRLKDLTVRSYVDLARRIGRDKQGKTSSFQQDWVELENGSEVGEHDDEGYYTEDGYISDDGTDAAFESDEDEYDTERKSGGKRKGKHGKKHKHKPNGAWFTFVKRAFVGTMDANDIEENFDAVQTVGEEFHEEKLMEL